MKMMIFCVTMDGIQKRNKANVFAPSDKQNEQEERNHHRISTAKQQRKKIKSE